MAEPEVTREELFEVLSGSTVTRLLPGGDYSLEARPPGGRRCGGCQACCKLVPVPEIRKSAGERCRHQKHAKGCAVYHKHGFPESCGVWSCRWLTDPDTAGLSRPDRSHCVIDMTTDTVGIDGVAVPVVQIWVDPAFRDAWRTPEMRGYIDMVGASYQCLTIIRFNSLEAIVVCPPSLSRDKQWHEHSGGKAVVRNELERLILADAEERRAREKSR
jgi:hypothetical protein